MQELAGQVAAWAVPGLNTLTNVKRVAVISICSTPRRAVRELEITHETKINNATEKRRNNPLSGRTVVVLNMPTSKNDNNSVS